MSTTITHAKTEAGFLWFNYFMFAGLVTAPIAFFICLFILWENKFLGTEEQAEHALFIAHYRWLVQTLAITVVLGMMALGTLYYIYGYAIGGAAIVWWCYRLGKGMWYLSEHKAP